MTTITELLQNNPYPGRGLLLGKTPDGKKAVIAYFIMGRSENSRNRIFKKENGILYTYPYDESKVQDKSLIIYNASRKLAYNVIVSNGDQTDTIYDFLKCGLEFEDALSTRTYEPDAPNYTPRISGIIRLSPLYYEIAIIKKDGEETKREYFPLSPANGTGYFISTYVTDGNPLPSFKGAPKEVEVKADMEEFARELWEALNEENKISLYVEYIDVQSGESKDIIINKNE